MSVVSYLDSYVPMQLGLWSAFIVYRMKIGTANRNLAEGVLSIIDKLTVVGCEPDKSITMKPEFDS